MTDVREAILARLVAIGEGVPGIVTSVRNKDQISESARPAIDILDADEVADDNDPNDRPTNAPRRIRMTPEIYLMAGAAPKDIGATINGYRAAFLKAVLTDATLKALVLDGIGIRYEGCSTGLARGRTMEGEMGLSFTFTYILRPDEL